MALTDDNSESRSRPFPDANAPEARALPQIPREALVRLPALHNETADALRKSTRPYDAIGRLVPAKARKSA